MCLAFAMSDNNIKRYQVFLVFFLEIVKQLTLNSYLEANLVPF